MKGVSLEVRPREVLCILGHSGSGKTSLLRIAAGIEEQASGSVSVGGTVVADDRVFVPAEQRPVGIVFQDLALFPHMSVGKNVGYGLRRSARRSAEIAKALEWVGLPGFETKYPHQLSGGEQQRVALLRALLPGPAVLLLDEPFSGLDHNLRNEIREELIDILRERGATTVMVTHNPQEALAVADRIALMRRGTIVQTDTPQAIWAKPVDLEAARMFGPVSEFTASVSAGEIDTLFGKVTKKLTDGAKVSVGFRPEAFSLHDPSDAVGQEATVRRRRFFGSFVEYWLKLEQSGLPVCARLPISQLVDGDRVSVRADLAQAMILPAV